MCSVTGDAARPPRLGWAVEDVAVASPALGQSWRVLVQRSARTPAQVPWLWLLHGSAAGADQMRPLLRAAAESMDAGIVPPMIIAAPDAPEGYRSSWWVDSAYEPLDDPPNPVDALGPRAGRQLERGLLGDVLPAIEERFGPPLGAGARTIGGISMGGAAALRWVIARPDLFGSAVLLSPAAYEPAPSDDSTARTTGAFGVGPDRYHADRFRDLMHYPTLLADRPETMAPTRVVIIVGDEEPAQYGDGKRCDLDLEAARLHAQLKVRPDFESVLRVVGGGHDWPVWERGIGDALRLLSS